MVKPVSLGLLASVALERELIAKKAAEAVNDDEVVRPATLDSGLDRRFIKPVACLSTLFGCGHDPLGE